MNIEDASKIVGNYLGAMNGDSSTEWHLEEFDGGWIVVRDGSAVAMMGEPRLVVERATGSLKWFPSSVPPALVRSQWQRVRAQARNVSYPAGTSDDA